LEAVTAMDAAGEAVSPTTVARRARVSRQWLYTFDEALEAIRAADAATRSTGSAVPRAQAPSAASSQRRIEALTDDNQRLRRRVQELEQRLAAMYGEWRVLRDDPGSKPAPSTVGSLPDRPGPQG
jgi:hypothetical protein